MMNLKPLPPAFVLGETNLTWTEALWGYNRQIVLPVLLVELALKKCAEAQEGDPVEIRLAGLLRGERTEAPFLAAELAAKEGEQSSERIARKWLYLMLLWLHRNMSQFPKPLERVEEVYADFEYPLEIANFVYYMPPADGYDSTAHSSDENENRLFDIWSDYLERGRREFGLAM